MIKASLDRAGLDRAAGELARRDPHLRRIWERLGPPPLWKRSATFATLVRIILEQQVSLASAKSTFDRLAAHCQGRITAPRVVALGETRLRTLGLTRQKSRYVRLLAEDVNKGVLRVGGLSRLDDEMVRRQLTAHLGLGDWSADVFLLMALGRPDILPLGDLALITGLSELDGGSYDSKDKVLRRAEPWRPYRSVATRMIWQMYLDRRRRK